MPLPERRDRHNAIFQVLSHNDIQHPLFLSAHSSVGHSGKSGARAAIGGDGASF
jgi:hypothetical protein